MTNTGNFAYCGKVDPEGKDEEELLGDRLEAGWAKRGARSSFRRNVEVWKILAQVAIKAPPSTRASLLGT